MSILYCEKHHRYRDTDFECYCTHCEEEKTEKEELKKFNMSLTVGEVKENSEYNFAAAKSGLSLIQKEIVKEQQKNYKIAKKLGANDEDNWYNWEDKVEEYKNKE